MNELVERASRLGESARMHGMDAPVPVRKLRRVGHKGAGDIVQGNTLESFDVALAHGVDMIEFDVLEEPRTGRLLLAHDYSELKDRDPLTLEEGIAHLASERFAGVELNVDLKLPGYEKQVVEQLQTHGVAGRTIVSTHFPVTLARIKNLDPEIRLGWSVPRARRDYTQFPLFRLPAYGILAILKRGLPGRAAAAIAAGRVHAIMAHWLLVTPDLVRAVDAAGGELFAWTVDEARRIKALEALGVTGVITNDPRLFEAPAAEAPAT